MHAIKSALKWPARQWSECVSHRSEQLHRQLHVCKHAHVPINMYSNATHARTHQSFSSHSPHRIKIELLNQEYTVYYIGTNLGRIYKIVQYYRNNEPFSKLLDIFEVAAGEPIQVMEISQARKSLYVATDHRIKQIDLAMCNRRYDSCFRCVKDPYCGWDKEANVCKPYTLGALQVINCHHLPLGVALCCVYLCVCILRWMDGWVRVAE